ncbi:hypothetical protein [Limobrevibacterium gyesilva]|nr:hypothetical protein [Limobrevibacterium gyesilva]
MTQLTAASWETIVHRSALMARGKCTPAEYRRMVIEKAAAAQAASVALLTGRRESAVLAPFLKRARANAKRLRRKS